MVRGLDTLPRKEKLTVARLFFEGNTVLDDDDIAAGISLTGRPWSVWGVAQPFDARLLREDLVRIENIYRRNGYYRAKVVDVSIALRGDGRSVDVTFVIAEGKPTRLRAESQIVYPGAATDEVRALQKVNPLQLGDVFSVQAFENAKATLRLNLRSSGFYAAEVSAESWVYPARYAAAATYVIDAGRRVHFGPVSIDGLDEVAENLVRREINWREGDWYNQSLVEETIQDLYALNLFRVVRIVPDPRGGERDPMPMRIEVVEAPWQNARLGAGYGTDDRVRLSARYAHENFIGGGRRLSLQARYSFLLADAEATLLQPYLGSKRNQATFTLLYRRERVVDAFVSERTMASPRFVRRFNRRWNASLGYRIEYNRALEVEQGIPTTERRTADPGFLSGAEATLERHEVDSLLFPSRGNVTRASYFEAGRVFGGRFDFYKWSLESRQYVSPWRRMVFELRGHAGAAEPYPGSRVPLYEKFYSGGTASVRGYRQDRLGPQIGGRTLVELNAEVRYRTFGGFWVAGFTDMGMVDLEAYRWSPNQVRWGLGPGVRVRTLIGLVRADVGIPLQARLGEPAWRLHLSIGQGF